VKNTIKCISWAAVSSKPQTKGESLDDQHRRNHALADALSWDVVADITVPGESRSYQRMAEATEAVEAYRQLSDLAQSSNIDWVIVKSRDRLARTHRLNRELADFLADRGVRVYSRTFPPGNLEERDQSAIWSEAIESSLSETEILRLTQHHETGMIGRVKGGKIPNTPPWGFHRIVEDGEETIVFHDPEAERAVRFAIERYHRGIALTRILEEAHRLELRSPTGLPWKLGTINAIVLQPNYYGLTAWGRTRRILEDGRKKEKDLPPDQWIIARGHFEGLYAPEDWTKTLAERKRRRDEHPRRRGTRYPLSGIAWCAECDQPMVGFSRHGSRRYYRCRPHLWEAQPRTGPHHYVRADHLHRELGEWLAQAEQTPALLAKMLSREPEDTGAAERERHLLLAQAADLLRRRQRWGDAYENGAIDLSVYAGRLRSIETQETAIESRLSQIQSTINCEQIRLDFASQLHEALRELPEILSRDLTPNDYDYLRQACSTFLSRVTIRDKHIEAIELALP